MVSVERPVWGMLELVCVLKSWSSTAGPTTRLSQQQMRFSPGMMLTGDTHSLILTGCWGALRSP